ncbi:MAG: SIMPL domain-containing protein [Pseudomonadota bacterium]
MLKTFLIATLMMTTTALAAEDRPMLSLTGTGVVDRAPDIATIRVGVNTGGKTAREALDENTNSATAVIKTLKDAGVAEKDIQTSNFGIQPIYKDRKTISSRSENPIDYYRVSNMVSAVIRDMDNIGSVLDQVIGAGGNQVNGISFGLSTRDVALEEARVLAVKDALRKAKLYSEAAGVSLGPILSISESGDHFAPQAEVAFMRSASAPVPIQGGEVSVTANVNIVWQIGE